MATLPTPPNTTAPAPPKSGSDSPVPAAAAPMPAAAATPAAHQRDTKAEREARLAVALRENLKRRKAQARARREPGETGAS